MVMKMKSTCEGTGESRRRKGQNNGHATTRSLEQNERFSESLCLTVSGTETNWQYRIATSPTGVKAAHWRGLHLAKCYGKRKPTVNERRNIGAVTATLPVFFPFRNTSLLPLSSGSGRGRQVHHHCADTSRPQETGTTDIIH